MQKGETVRFDCSRRLRMNDQPRASCLRPVVIPATNLLIMPSMAWLVRQRLDSKSFFTGTWRGCSNRKAGTCDEPAL